MSDSAAILFFLVAFLVALGGFLVELKRAFERSGRR